MNILITGGSGFLGSALTRHFVQQNHCVALLSRPSSKLDRLDGIEPDSFKIGRCSDDQQVKQFVQSVQPEIVIHTACMYGRHGEGLADILDTNLRLGVVLLEALGALKQPITFVNTGTVLEPNVSPYALSKQQFVAWGRRISKDPSSQIKFINVLLQHMYGPGDDSSKFTTMVLKACQLNQQVLDLTAGEQKRDFVFIDDVVAAYDLILDQRATFDSFDEIDVGSGEAPTLREVVETIHLLCQSKTTLNFGAAPYRVDEAMYCKADITRLQTLGWSPKFDLIAGLKKTIGLGI